MAEGDDLLQKADALMRRHRAGAAGEGEPSPADGDVPVLTEVVDAPLPAAGTNADPAALRDALARELETWLDRELPQHVMHVLDGITDQMIMQLSSKARAELLPKLQALVEAAAEPEKPASPRD